MRFYLFKNFSGLFFFLLALGVFGGTYSIIKEKNQFENEAFHQASTTPAISGPDRLCNVFGSVIGTFSGGGNPLTDLYQWTIIGPGGEILRETQYRSTPDISYTFGLLGPHRVILKVTRAGLPFFEQEKTVLLIKGPDIALQPTYQLCQGQSLNISALDPGSANFGSYAFEWKNQSGATVGTSNTLAVDTPGDYVVTFYFLNSSGVPECETTLSTRIGEISPFVITSTSSVLCPAGNITFETNPITSGEWYYQKIGTPAPIRIASGNSLVLEASSLPEPGDYEIIVRVDNPQNPACSPEVRTTIQYNILPQIKIEEAIGATGCFEPDGILKVRALTNLDGVSINGLGMSQGPFLAGDLIQFNGLKSGAYSIIANLNGCSEIFGSVVPLQNPPSNLEFAIDDIQPEICTETGKDLGSFLLRMINAPLEGSYRILNLKGEVVANEAGNGLEELRVSISGGKYFFQVFDTDSCTLPKSEEFEVPGLAQVSYSIPGDLFVCQSYDLTPESSFDLEYTLTYPDGSKKTLGQGAPFTITEGGDYTIVGRLAGPGDLCPFLQEFSITMVNPVDFEPVLIQEDCDGNRTYEADIRGRDPSTVKFLWFNENDELVGNGQFLFPTSTGEFKLDVQPANSTACPSPPVPFLIPEPILEVEVELVSTKLCEYGPRAVLDLNTTFPEAVTDIEWRRYDEDGTITTLDNYANQKQVLIELPGIYEAAVFSRIPSIGKDCELGRSSLEIDLILDKVNFEIPGDLSICDPFELIPESSRPLIFTLTYPDGKEETKNLNEPFTLNQEGSYTILGFDPDPKGPECPEQKTFEVKINPPVQFSLELVNLDCNGIYEYEAEVTNYLPSEVDFFWFDPSGTLVSNTSSLSTSTYGEFRVEIQPSGSIPCENQFKTLFVPDPILQVSTKIIAEALCPDQPNAALKVDANLEPVQTIHWWFTDLSNNRRPLSNLTNQQEILAFEEGTYEVQLLNRFNCLLGQDQTLVIRSTDQVRPELDEAYQICPKYDIAPTLSPGNFASYEWIFEGNLVSTSSTFKPLQIGSYEVIVTSAEGCAYQTSFITEEECELRLRLPNAIQPENPDKPFLIYTNYLVDELEVWIYNKWGNLIFHCKNSDLIDQESTCLWDGLYNGKKVPPGAYAFRINYQNYERGIKREQLGTVQVIE
ncbi:CHU domain-containing protein [Algoriphagus aquaeductus]|uniref:CHU domain-containing protein n=1 Tax=Algoriphagus aquaeductus TaxID=475299 RepID=A0A326S412_9BACT|nr:CHU domain-containing protein [Algoriphagus aquaeductus]